MTQEMGQNNISVSYFNMPEIAGIQPLSPHFIVKAVLILELSNWNGIMESRVPLLISLEAFDMLMASFQKQSCGTTGRHKRAP